MLRKQNKKMKKRILNILTSVLLLTGIMMGQQYTGPSSSMRYPTNVIFISPNYIVKTGSPFYPTLASAITAVGSTATSGNPYVFWIACDTNKITDWSTGKASFRSTYVQTGKIKVAGFYQEGVDGIVGVGGGGAGVPTQDETTARFGWANWDQGDATLPFWVQILAETIDEIDYDLWRKTRIVSGGGGGISISQTDTTVEIDIATNFVEDKVTQALGDVAIVTDTTHVVKDNTPETIRNIYTFKNTGLKMGDSSYIQLPLENWSGELPRIIWADSGNRIHFSGNGGESSYTTLIGKRDDTGFCEEDSIFQWNNLNKALRDSIQGIPAFGNLYITSTDPDTVVSSNYQSIQDFSTGVYKNIALNDSSFIISYEGYYRVSITATLTTATTTNIIKVYVDDVANEQITAETYNPNNGASISASGILYLSANDIVEMKISSATSNAIIKRANFNIERIRD